MHRERDGVLCDQLNDGLHVDVTQLDVCGNPSTHVGCLPAWRARGPSNPRARTRLLSLKVFLSLRVRHVTCPVVETPCWHMARDTLCVTAIRHATCLVSHDESSPRGMSVSNLRARTRSALVIQSGSTSSYTRGLLYRRGPCRRNQPSLMSRAMYRATVRREQLVTYASSSAYTLTVTCRPASNSADSVSVNAQRHALPGPCFV